MVRSLYPRPACRNGKQGYRRRDFLKLTLAASASLLLASCAMPPPERSGRPVGSKKVIIIGAGLAGLACAYELQHANYQVTVIEARRRLGGRVVTYTDFPGGKQVEGGGEFISARHATWLAYARRFGLSLREITPVGELNRPVVLGGQRLTGAEVEALYEEMAAAYAQLSVEAATVDPGQPWTHPDAVSLDRRTVAAWIESLTVSARAKAAIATDLAAENGVSPHCQSYLGLLAMIKGGSLESAWTESEIYRCVGGNQQLAEYLARGVGLHRLKFGTPVTALRVQKHGIEVEMAGRETLAGDDVVLTVPPSVWHRIHFSPPLPAGLLPQMGTAVKYLALVKNRFWRIDKQSPYAFTDGLSNYTWEATDGQPGEPAVLTAFSGGPAAQKVRRRWRQQGEAVFHSEFAQLYPRFPENILVGRFIDWPADPWTGAGYSFPSPGQVTTLGPLLYTGLGRLHFAGEYTAYQFIGYMEGALASGVSLAKRLIERDRVIAAPGAS
jgi:monoamine oxidase